MSVYLFDLNTVMKLYLRYYVGRGAQEWKNYDLNSTCLGSEDDDGVLYVC